VFLLRRRQADVPNQCSKKQTSFMFLLWFAFSCIALCSDPSYLRTLQRVCSLSHCLQLLLIRHGSSCVLRSTSFIRSSLRSIPPSSQLINLLQGMACMANTQINTHAVTYLFASQRYNTHWVPFRFVRRYFISVLLSPPAANNFARRLSPLRLRSACEC